ncbi:MAG: hydrogenase maturation protease [Sciscionella sp.]
MTPRVLVAGIGNIFLGDDGFGVEVARRLSYVELPDGVQVADYGISGMHLAYDLTDGFDTVIMVDALCRNEEPGTLFVLQVGRDQFGSPGGQLDAHGMQPAAVLGLLDMLGGEAGRVLVVGCEPESVEDGIGLSVAVSAALDKAVELVSELAEESCGVATASRATRTATGRR